MAHGRSATELVEEQMRRAQLPWARERTAVQRGVVALSRLSGARGDEVAGRLSAVLGYSLYDREIIQRIARELKQGEEFVATLDEKDRPFVREWLVSLGGRNVSTFEYLHHLRLVVEAIARMGGAVIVGRGAHAILGPSQALRVLVVAPRETRVACIALKEGLALSDARRRIELEEAERQAFLRKHFHESLSDPEAFDLVVNTQVLGVEGSVETIRAALARLEPATRSRGATVGDLRPSPAAR
jgi:cytidylate kinase